MSKLSDEDKKAFKEAMQGIRPLEAIPRYQVKKKKPSAHRKSSAIEDEEINIPALSDHYMEPVTADDKLSYRLVTVSSKQFAQLKAGKIPITASLDLHGLSVVQAKKTLVDFLNKHPKKTGRIIHGKGNRYNTHPTLKNHVNHWLKQLPEVAAFHSAATSDGGGGALYVLLK